MERVKYITGLVTCPRDKAAEISRQLVQERLAACVNIVPGLRSIYQWQGEICDDEEALLVIKTRAALFPALKDRVLALHPYEVPEVIALPIIEGHAPYLQWIEGETRGETP